MRNLVPAATRLGLAALGASVGPAAFLGAGFLASFLGAVFRKEIFGERGLGEAAANLLAELSADSLRGLFESSRSDPNRNYDIERVMAEAIRQSLEEIHEETRGFDGYFQAWLLHLSQPEQERLQTLFASGNANDAILLAERPELWWPHLETALCRWYVEQQQQFDAMNLSLPDLPPPLAKALREQLPARADKKFSELLKADNPARHGFEHRFLRHLSEKIESKNSGVAAALKSIADTLRETAGLTLTELTGFREEFRQFAAELRTREGLLTAGEIRLALVPRQARLADRPLRHERDLLDAAFEAIPLVHREKDLDDCIEWLRSDKPLSVLAVHGRAGAGKTRFAFALLERVERELPDWRAGFASARRMPGVYARWDSARPALLIFDYAASQHGLIKLILSELRDLRSRAPVRILLLDRQASKESGWLRSLWDETDTGRRLEDFIEEPVRLQPLDNLEVRKRILASSLQACRLYLGAPAVPVPVNDADFERRLLQPQWEDPLYLMMAAVVSSSSSVVGALSLQRTELARKMAGREAARLQKFTPDGDGKALLVHLAACATLAQGMDCGECIAMARAERDRRFGQSLSPQGMWDLAAAALGTGEGGRLLPVTPDMIGEAFVLETPGFETEAVSVLAAKVGTERLIPALVHTIQSFSSIAIAGTPDERPLQWADMLIQDADVEVLRAFERSIPETTLALKR